MAVPDHLRGVLSYGTMESGELFVVIVLIIEQLQLFVASLDIWGKLKKCENLILTKMLKQCNLIFMAYALDQELV